jgi:hypothetical protein
MKAGDETAYHELVESCVPLVRRMAQQVCEPAYLWNYGDEALSFGLWWLARYVRRLYDATRNCKLSTCVAHYGRLAMRTHVEKLRHERSMCDGDGVYSYPSRYAAPDAMLRADDKAKLVERYEQAIERYDPRALEILHRSVTGESFHDMAADFGLTREGVRYVYRTAIRRAREALHEVG